MIRIGFSRLGHFYTDSMTQIYRVRSLIAKASAFKILVSGLGILVRSQAFLLLVFPPSLPHVMRCHSHFSYIIELITNVSPQDACFRSPLEIE